MIQDDMGVNLNVKKLIGTQDSEQNIDASFKNNNLLVSKFQNKIHLEKIEKAVIPTYQQNVLNSLQANTQKIDQNKIRIKDKKDRATIQQVLDPRTLVILSKFIKQELICEINGCVSTGKEANIYHSLSFDKKKEYAIKIYKTSILIFKDREQYIAGEFRFRKGFCKGNPRKLIKVWAEKEFRNLKRIFQCGKIPCPEPFIVKQNVLLMDFIGNDYDAAPKLRDADVDQQTWSNLYLQLLKYMRILYQTCKLIHADLSEYNLLYYKEKIWMIDVSQSIEHDHPHALQFLRMDIFNVNNFFEKKSVMIFKIREIFDFITDISIKEENMDEYLNNLIHNNINNNNNDTIKDNEEVFTQAHIPRTLHEVSLQQAEKDFKKLQNPDNKETNKSDDVLYDKLTGISVPKKKSHEYKEESKYIHQREARILEQKKPNYIEKVVTLDENNEILLEKLAQNKEIQDKEQKTIKFNEINEENEKINEIDQEQKLEKIQEENAQEELRDEHNQENKSNIEEDEGEVKEKKQRGDVLYAGLTKQQRKQKVKDEKREKRENKIPKYQKKKQAKKK